MFIRVMDAFLLLSLFILYDCSNNNTDPVDSLKIYKAGNSVIFSAESTSVVMIYVEGKEFPSDVNDLGSTRKIAKSFWICETEVTYKLWKLVLDWAVQNKYTFENLGKEGCLGLIGAASISTEPVTNINWRDAMVFCNAVTEFFNYKLGLHLSCVYTNNSDIIRSSVSTNAMVCDLAYTNDSANGFRLLTKDELELAMRWRNDDINSVDGYQNPWFTKGNSASGADADYSNSAETDRVAVYNANTIKTCNVKSKFPNSLHIYDLSGNVWEWCVDLYGSNRVGRGGSYSNTAENLQIGRWGSLPPETKDFDIGFRLAQNI